MRVKKQKQVRRHVRFYKSCCGFREPFKVLCDGNFVHAVLAARIGSLHDVFPALLGASAKAYVTRCVIGELKKLGEAFSGAVMATRRLEVAKCNHDPLLPAVNCLEAMVGSKNREHFFVATQDPELRRKLRKAEGGALIFLQNTGVILEQPSLFQRSQARLSETDRIHMAQVEQKVVENRLNQKESQVSTSDLVADDEQNQKINEVKEVSRFRRQRAKGPNPLSQKRKQNKTTGMPLQQLPMKDSSLPEGSNNKSKRRRHRKSRKTNVDGEHSAGVQSNDSVPVQI